MGKEYTRLSSIIGNVPALGSVLLFDDFEGTFKWLDVSTGAGTAEQSTTKLFRGSKAMHLWTQPTTPLKTDSVRVWRFFPLLRSSIITIEFFYHYPSSSPFGNLDIELQHDNLANSYFATIRYDHDNAIWQKKVQGGTYSNIPGSDYIHGPRTWHKFKLVIDLLNFKYSYFQLDSLSFDLSTTLLHKAATNNFYSTAIYLQIWPIGDGDQGRIYIDDFLISEIN